MNDKYYSDDITFCTNKKCTTTKCMRNPKNIRVHDIPHSFADLDGNKNYCLKERAKMENQQRRKIIAVDFDGTLFENAYPSIGKPKEDIILWCKLQKAAGSILILWTCRVGAYLQAAVKECEEVGLTFDYINESARENVELYGGVDTRKIYADIYLDDKSYGLADVQFELFMARHKNKNEKKTESR